ncbi:GAF domain-containing protein [Pigmentiphaga aceris]|uniref:histidine kinase n=1 Tax=Pigmentiphaga aceris TaxID=1940612 RepID=A0A5C0AVA5_9BURK|nr:ATP-binding protein [Pigmentiphaga aceris]QEI06125.1 GAF domain-containing protein [Pigmentiphaga aceris]
MLSDDAIAQLEANCAREPIQIPGAIQPHGFLIAFVERDGVVRHVSGNLSTFLAVTPENLIGQSVAVLRGELGASLKDAAEQLLAAADGPMHAGSINLLGASGLRERFELLLHRRGDLIIAELEPAAAPSQAQFASMYPVVNAFVSRIQAAQTVDAICATAAEEVKRLTGYGRVVTYSFDADGHGYVNAEVIDEGYESFLGLRFPASDIPTQARALYLSNRIRVIHDADYVPSPIVPAHDPDTSLPLDMSLCGLRSVSPVHLQYMRNMGTLASMSVSIIVEGRLWGLISCHHATPKPVSMHTRSACDVLGRMLSLQVEAKEANSDALRRLELRNIMVRMLSAMSDRDRLGIGLTRSYQPILEFARAGGAAVVYGADCDMAGATPAREVVVDIARWLFERGEREVFHTDSFPRIAPEFAASADVASGLLAISISERHPNYVMWFRPEVQRTVNWAGRPEKNADDLGRLSPRTSFTLWEEILRERSLAWQRAEIDAAAEMRTTVLSVVLRRAEELAELALELGRLNKELEAFSYSVSHDLRAPLRHIAGYAELLSEMEGDKLADRSARYLEHINEAAQFAGLLVDGLLTFSQMGRSALTMREVDVDALVQQVIRELAPDTQGRNIEWVIGELPNMYGDGSFLHLALRNLLSNAIKYTRTRQQARIEIGSSATDFEQVMYVKDNGVGFDPRFVGKLFGVFQRLHRMEDFEGTGIGLANVRRIVERHGGRVWAESEEGMSATFYLALPNAETAQALAKDETLPN